MSETWTIFLDKKNILPEIAVKTNENRRIKILLFINILIPKFIFKT